MDQNIVRVKKITWTQGLAWDSLIPLPVRSPSVSWKTRVDSGCVRPRMGVWPKTPFMTIVSTLWSGNRVSKETRQRIFSTLTVICQDETWRDYGSWLRITFPSFSSLSHFSLGPTQWQWAQLQALQVCGKWSFLSFPIKRKGHRVVLQHNYLPFMEWFCPAWKREALEHWDKQFDKLLKKGVFSVQPYAWELATCAQNPWKAEHQVKNNK